MVLRVATRVETNRRLQRRGFLRYWRLDIDSNSWIMFPNPRGPERRSARPVLTWKL